MQLERNQNILKATTIKYLANCFLLIVPIIIWNLAFRNLLPDAFAFDVYWEGLPPVVYWGEIIFRLLAYTLPLFMPLRVFGDKQKIGVTVYLVGLFLYFLSWRPLVLYPSSDWSTSLPGYLATAITPFIFLLGINLIGNKLFLKIPFSRKIYTFFVVGFTTFHIWHVVILHGRLTM